MKFKFEKLEVWKLAMNYGEDINKIVYKFPQNEMYNLSSQIRRAADSIALNIAEGSIGQSNMEQNRFVSYSIRSVSEVVTCLFKAQHREYINNQTFEELYNKAYELLNKLIALRNAISKSQNKPLSHE